jgi:hypothetical protein
MSFLSRWFDALMGASPLILSVLAVEVPASGKTPPAERHPRVNPPNAAREPELGRGTPRANELKLALRRNSVGPVF